MMQTSAKMIADSISPDGVRISTIECVLWRPILAELNTHRAFSRNSASSRARSVKKTLREVLEDPAGPPEFRREKIGMSGGELLHPIEAENAQRIWRFASEQALERAQELVDLGVHKSIVNRLIEPFMWHTVVITATDWDNFLEQRLALLDDGVPAADPAMYQLAVAINNALFESVPHEIDYGGWHLPYITQDDWDVALMETMRIARTRLMKISVARCAGVSYLSQGAKDRDWEKDVSLYHRLRNANPPHWSPFEHVATPALGRDAFDEPLRFYNLSGWSSLRWVEEMTQR